jgi:hypothetical protein
MTLRGRPIGICLLSLWSAVQAVPGAWLSLGASGKAAAAGWAFFIGEIAVAAGLLIPVIAAWYFALASLTINVLLFSAALWVCAFIAAAWGLHSTELMAAIGVGLYFVFLSAGFIYLFHPEVDSYFRGSVNQPMA